jgi:hypothetical protein
MTATTTTTQSNTSPGVFIPDIYNQLPPILKDCVNALKDPNDKAVFLIGALAVISGLMPNVQGVYDNKPIYPNLYAYLIGPYGSGKGALNYCSYLVKPTHDTKRDKAKELAATYESEMEIYKEHLKLFKKGSTHIKPVKPDPPKTLLKFIPANNSKSGLIVLLLDNDGNGIIFETESDTLSDALKQDYGGFSEVLRQAFHHEPVRYFRKVDNVYIEIESPKLSVALSSTLDQVLTLIPTAETVYFPGSCFTILNMITALKMYSVMPEI